MSYFITQSNTVMIYPSVVLLGLGFSSMLVCSLSFATELIGENKVNKVQVIFHLIFIDRFVLFSGVLEVFMREIILGLIKPNNFSKTTQHGVAV